MTVLARVYLVRHGETDENRNGIIQGQLDTSLNSVGMEQARLVGEALKSIPFEIALSSDLNRAAKTTEAILAHHPHLELQKQTELRERHMGEMQGRTWTVQARPQAGPSDRTIESGAFFAARAESWWIKLHWDIGEKLDPPEKGQLRAGGGRAEMPEYIGDYY
ncbi:hypothetical protein D9615_004161 [Tricholomella constricta]|uniref:Phosphoglycerate mutase n=1 Tax=Tricholomella constricta TaxID=117010 RepID=A0A8H5HCQ9_9AGAR|nr:hypothetical protein D9615_004161 [Tricholomella constricta]